MPYTADVTLSDGNTIRGEYSSTFELGLALAHWVPQASCITFWVTGQYELTRCSIIRADSLSCLEPASVYRPGTLFAMPTGQLYRANDSGFELVTFENYFRDSVATVQLAVLA